VKTARKAIQIFLVIILVMKEGQANQVAEKMIALEEKNHLQ